MSPLHDSKLGQFIFFIYLSSDALVRSGGYALVLSPSIRTIGFPVAVAFALCQLALSFGEKVVNTATYVWNEAQNLVEEVNRTRSQNNNASAEQSQSRVPLGEDWDIKCAYNCLPIADRMGPWVFGALVALVVGIAVLIVAALLALPFGCLAIAYTAVPIVLTFKRPQIHKVAFGLTRLLEYLCFGLLITSFGRSVCGQAVFWETAGYFTALGANAMALLIFVCMHYCVGGLVILEKDVKDMLLSAAATIFGGTFGSRCPCFKEVDTE
mmetsp:Transcript_50405/g.117585  ORF Transcript_50405/g.117585 Transcript_50405/m.117585 type:complete len:268 (+) Transcript_50405:1044-1847(+)